MAAWNGPRHRSWARDTNLTAVFAGCVVIGYVVWELVGEAPQGMVTLVGLAGGALFGAVSKDKQRRDADTRETANHAEQTANRAEATANSAARQGRAGEQRADAAEVRESEPSLHRHDDAGSADA